MSCLRLLEIFLQTQKFYVSRIGSLELGAYLQSEHSYGGSLRPAPTRLGDGPEDELPLYFTWRLVLELSVRWWFYSPNVLLEPVWSAAQKM
jgi:hypothetical protein